MAGENEIGRVVDAAERVRAMIRTENLRIGDPLPSEAALGERLGVSRAVVREANRALAALGLIDIANGRRARVAATRPEVLGVMLDHAVQTDAISILQILDVRRTIEMRIVGLAALRRSDAEAVAIARLADAMAAGFPNPDAVMEADLDFHVVIAAAARNPMFALMVGGFQTVTRQTWATGWAARGTEAGRRANIACHQRIAAAIADRDVPAAEAAMAEHFDDTARVLLAAGLT